MTPTVGIFFFVNDKVVFDAAPLAQAELYGDSMGFSGHYDFWEALIPKSPIEQLFKSHEYDYFPRGRIVYFMKSKRFRLYADHCLKKADFETIATTFHLPDYQLARDEHYQCAHCNPDYMDF